MPTAPSMARSMTSGAAADLVRTADPAYVLSTAPEIVAAVKPLLHALDVSPGVRLLGVSGSNFGGRSEQLDLFSAAPEETPDVQRSAAAIDQIREKFGAASIGPASSISGDKLRVVRRGAQQWGPDQQPDHTRSGDADVTNDPN